MKHKHNWKMFADIRRPYDKAEGAFCSGSECRARMLVPEVDAALVACDGVKLGEGADVKKLIETFQEVIKWFGNVRDYEHFGALIDINEGAHKKLLEKARAILAPLMED